jgi:4-methylaminobutanoate oxidase (formaldehyde-forming)
MGAACGVNVPLHSAEHFYVITKAIEGCDLNLPVFRDPDALIYTREWSGGLCVGGFELDAKPVFGGARGVPDDFAFGLFDEDWDHFAPLYEGAMERFPALHDVEIQSMVNGPESFTIDNQYILGEAPELDNLYVCGGMNSSGIASAGGAGFALAEWITAGGPTMDMWAVDIRRFGPQ